MAHKPSGKVFKIVSMLSFFSLLCNLPNQGSCSTLASVHMVLKVASGTTRLSQHAFCASPAAVRHNIEHFLCEKSHQAKNRIKVMRFYETAVMSTPPPPSRVNSTCYVLVLLHGTLSQNTPARLGRDVARERRPKPPSVATRATPRATCDVQ